MSIKNLEEAILINDLLAPESLAEDKASPLYPPRHSSVAATIRQYYIIVRVMLTEYRTIWFLQVFMGLLLPAGIIFFLKSVDIVNSPAQAIFLLGGNMATSIAFGPTNFLSLSYILLDWRTS
jgi:hypothetical protein